MRSLVLSLIVVASVLSMASAQKKEVAVTHHAHGTFTVKMAPLTPGPAEGLGRFSIDKEIHGDLEATSKGEMISGGDYKLGEAGYVAIELVTGTLAGKKGLVRAAADGDDG